MRPRVAAIALLSATFLSGQSNTPTLDVGTVTLSLGLSRQVVRQKFERAGYELVELAPKDGQLEAVVTRADLTDPVKQALALVDNDGRLFFRQDSLIRVVKEIQTNLESDRDLVAGLYAIIRQYEREKSNQLCFLGTLEETFPEHAR